MEKEETQNFALALWNYLHSSAGENIISSLLTATLNESDDLRAWLIKRVTKHERNCSKIHAAANCLFPKCLIKNRNVHTDLMLWDCTRDAEWFKFENNKVRRKAKRLANNLWGIYIEVKHEWLQSDDAKQYEDCAKALKAVNNRFFFVLVSSHSKKAKERISEHKPKSSQVLNWHKVFNNKKICHITFKEIYDQLEQIENESSKNYLVLPIFREYLRLYLNPENIGHWRALFDYYKKAEFKTKELRTDLKSSMYWAIINVGMGEGFIVKRRRYDTDKVHSVTFVPSDYSTRIETNNSNTELEVKIDGERNPISFTEFIENISYKDKNNFHMMAEQISKRLTKLRKKLTSCVNK